MWATYYLKVFFNVGVNESFTCDNFLSPWRRINVIDLEDRHAWIKVRSNLVNTTLVIWHPLHYGTLLLDQFFKVNTPSFLQLRHLIMQHLESPFCHIEEAVDNKILFSYVMHIWNTYIFTWELLGNFTYHWELN